MISATFINELNCGTVRIDNKEVFIDGIYIEGAECETVEKLEHARAFRIVLYKNVHYRQNGYYRHERNGSTTFIFNEQEWYIVTPKTKVIYEYQ